MSKTSKSVILHKLQEDGEKLNLIPTTHHVLYPIEAGKTLKHKHPPYCSEIHNFVFTKYTKPCSMHTLKHNNEEWGATKVLLDLQFTIPNIDGTYLALYQDGTAVCIRSLQ